MNEKFKADIFRQRVPCEDCPFRREGGVRHSTEMMVSYISYFVSFPGASFPCHKSVLKSDDRSTWSEWQDGQVLCVGGLIFATKQRCSNFMMRAATVFGWYSPAQHTDEEKSLVFDSIEEMLANRKIDGGGDGVSTGQGADTGDFCG